ncbi:MAG: tRNA (adenosine(37)-N6)-threonylcarbamoyltransferase complex ATPase subunit type 1 TsaE [Planctomycetes bacterium]|nr:tRNA (adenosine(37)-N6)-threonylcarbamoyltransferase complex ATPase subunit type 1 TsaE [Planctomycetota bacterium]
MQDFLDDLSPSHLTVDVPSATSLELCAELLAPLLKGGDFIGLVGDLGAGKTTWCRGLGKGLHAKTPLRSPSYLLMHEIEADLPILHIDAYFETRLDSLLGAGEYERFDGSNLVLVEWANHASNWWPQSGLYLGLSHNISGGRSLSVHSIGQRGQSLAIAYCDLLKKLNFFEPGSE